MNMTVAVQTKARRPLGRRSRYRSGSAKQGVAISLTKECVAQLDEMTKRESVGNRSEFVEALVWWAARRKKLLR